MEEEQASFGQKIFRRVKLVMGEGLGPYAAVVKVDGEFVLATHYGGLPVCLGFDISKSIKDIPGVIKAARMWEIGYLAEGHRGLVTGLVPEARFAPPDGKFRIRLIGDQED